MSVLEILLKLATESSRDNFSYPSVSYTNHSEVFIRSGAAVALVVNRSPSAVELYDEGMGQFPSL